MKKALVTGAAGFVGSHLIEHLLENNIAVTAIIHPKHSSNNIDPLKNKISVYEADLTQKKEFNKIKNWNYNYVFHLAAFSSPHDSFKKPQDTIKNNVFCQLSLLEQLKGNKSNAKILIVGSADEYGDVDQKYLPVNEDAPLSPTSPYAVSKVAQDLLGYQYFLNYGLNIVRVRPFNHIGPRQSHQFVVASFANQIAMAERKGGGAIKVGNLESFRDFTDVRDIVNAYLLALENGDAGEVYNIGSGNAYKISDILNKLIKISTVKIEVKQEKGRVRKSDIKKIYCDYSKFKSKTGWQPTINIDTTLFDTIEYERKNLN